MYPEVIELTAAIGDARTSLRFTSISRNSIEWEERYNLLGFNKKVFPGISTLQRREAVPAAVETDGGKCDGDRHDDECEHADDPGLGAGFEKRLVGDITGSSLRAAE